MSDVDFGVQFRCNDERWLGPDERGRDGRYTVRDRRWLDLEFFDLYEHAVDYALEVQSQYDECRIIMYKSLSEENGHHKSKIVAVFKPMPRGWIAKAKGGE